jgi:hypothetical protein
MNYPLPGEKWRHYKGGVYTILTLANHSETREPMVVYQSDSFGSTYVRPLAMWEDDCIMEGKETKRFVRIL